MKAVILCGGKGTRISEETKNIPKPMVKIGEYPIILHIINYYYSFGVKEYILTLGIWAKLLKIILLIFIQNLKLKSKLKKKNLK